MQEETQETPCQNPLCERTVTQTPGHRKRQYCDDACKQTAYRLRLEEAARREREEAERQLEVQARASLRARYTAFAESTIDFFRSLEKQGQYGLVRQIAAVISSEREVAGQNETEQRAALIEECMVLGERMGYSALDLGRMSDHAGPGRYAVLGGVDNWSYFVERATVQMLTDLRNAALYQVEGYVQARRRLRLLSERSDVSDVSDISEMSERADISEQS